MVTSTEPAVKLTYEDYRKTPEDERYELIDGVLIMAASPNRAHQTTQRKLGAGECTTYGRELKTWEKYSSPHVDVVLSEHTTLQPDLIFVSKENEDMS